MEQYGNQTSYNIESVLHKNITGCEYYNKTCSKLENWTQVVDEIYETVVDVEPWMSGNARGASTAFCLLFRLCTLKITEEEVKALLDHTDSPYIRAVGFLYLRYVGAPKSLWQWLAPYVKDDEVFTPSPEGFGKSVTMGDFVRDIFLEQFYFETIFPRIPKPVHDDFVSKLIAMGLPSRAVRNGGQGGGDRRGVEEGNRRPASVKASLSVAFGQRAPNRATAREEGRGLGAGMRGGAGQATNDLRDRTRDQERDRGRDRDRHADRDRQRTRDREKERDRDRNRDRDRDRDRDKDRERDRRDRRDPPSRDQRSERHRSERDRRDRSRERRHESDRHRSRRDDESDRKREREAEHGKEQENEGKRSKERDASEVFKEKTTYTSHPDHIREKYGDASR